jgi:hypothetical protein
LSNEEKTNDYENFEKGMNYMKILKKGGVVEKRGGGGGNEIHAPCACGRHLEEKASNYLNYLNACQMHSYFVF